MIIDRHAGRLRLVTQSDHAHLAAQFLRLWRRDGLPDHPRRDTLLFATAEHDNGWREADAAPRVDRATGRPHDFRSLPSADRVDIWNRGVRRHADHRPDVALLITEHALTLFAGRDGTDGWSEVLDRWRAHRAALLETLERAPDPSQQDHAWLDLADALSLACAAGWREPVHRHGYHARLLVEDDALTTMVITPFPLAGATRFRLPCRLLDDRDYTSDVDLGVALASARWDERTIRLVPPSIEHADL